MNQTKTIRSTLREISKLLTNEEWNTPYAGLFNGFTGNALFYAYHYQITGKEEDLHALEETVTKTIAAFEVADQPYSHCGGMAGMAWCLQHLVQLGYIEADNLNDVFEEVDIWLGDYMLADLKEHRYDFLHEGLGIALYFAERCPHPVAQRYLEAAVQLLAESVQPLAVGHSWKDQFSRIHYNIDQDCYNLGLSHGVPAIISVLGKIHEKGIATAQSRDLMHGALQWLLSTRNTGDEEGHALFGTLVDAHNNSLGNRNSRLGWCYGDLGIATTFWNAGQQLQHPAYQDTAAEILAYTFRHRNHTNGMVVDAGLCHGAAGIAQVFRRFHRNTGDALLGNAADQWMDHTLQFRVFEDGLAGFKAKEKSEYVKCYNFLEGIAGIGLAMIAALDKDISPDWDRCLLLS